VEVDWIALARAEQTAWTRLTIGERVRRLRALRHRIAEETQHIVEVIREETGKTPLDALSGDVLVTLEQLLYNEKHAEHVLKTRPLAKPPLFYLGAQFEESREPYGVVLIYVPSNYPFQLSVIPMATALIAGNAVVVKCSEKTPRMARMLEELLEAAEFPEGLVQVVADAPEIAGNLIDAGPDLVFFTGSSENGRKVAMRAAEKLIPTMLELGGKDACVVFGDCNFERAVEGVAYGAFANAGQVCIGIRRLFVEESIFPKFLDALAERSERLRIGSSKDSDLGVLPVGAGRERFIAQVENAVRQGAKLHLPKRGEVSGEEPVILSDMPAGARLMAEEVFGPVVCAAPFRDEAEAVALANGSPFALSSSVWTGDAERGRRIAAQMSAGSCAVNDVIRNIANPHASFGGNQQSGYGRYHGLAGLLAFSRAKSVMTLHDRRKHELHWFPATAKTFRLLERVVAFRHGSGSLLWRIRQLW
jgi:4,4'-diapolycopenoate synthase